MNVDEARNAEAARLWDGKGEDVEASNIAGAPNVLPDITAPDGEAGIPPTIPVQGEATHTALIEFPTAAMREEFCARRYPGGRKPVSYRELAEAIDVPQQKLSDFENEKEVDIESLLRIAQWLGYSVLLVKNDPGIEDD
ncbi:MAG: helix-turn-helix transcriptional regulator [Gemmatimonadales bacterium]|jgi:hypothetical protein|nr:helix-turn-helix transcriptional regulator [Gemmatimonadales bacterium]